MIHCNPGNNNCKIPDISRFSVTVETLYPGTTFKNSMAALSHDSFGTFCVSETAAICDKHLRVENLDKLSIRTNTAFKRR